MALGSSLDFFDHQYFWNGAVSASGRVSMEMDVFLSVGVPEDESEREPSPLSGEGFPVFDQTMIVISNWPVSERI